MESLLAHVYNNSNEREIAEEKLIFMRDNNVNEYFSCLVTIINQDESDERTIQLAEILLDQLLENDSFLIHEYGYIEYIFDLIMNRISHVYDGVAYSAAQLLGLITSISIRFNCEFDCFAVFLDKMSYVDNSRLIHLYLVSLIRIIKSISLESEKSVLIYNRLIELSNHIDLIDEVICSFQQMTDVIPIILTTSEMSGNFFRRMLLFTQNYQFKTSCYLFWYRLSHENFLFFSDSIFDLLEIIKCDIVSSLNPDCYEYIFLTLKHIFNYQRKHSVIYVSYCFFDEVFDNMIDIRLSNLSYHLHDINEVNCFNSISEALSALIFAYPDHSLKVLTNIIEYYLTDNSLESEESVLFMIDLYLQLGGDVPYDDTLQLITYFIIQHDGLLRNEGIRAFIHFIDYFFNYIDHQKSQAIFSLMHYFFDIIKEDRHQNVCISLFALLSISKLEGAPLNSILDTWFSLIDHPNHFISNASIEILMFFFSKYGSISNSIYLIQPLIELLEVHKIERNDNYLDILSLINQIVKILTIAIEPYCNTLCDIILHNYTIDEILTLTLIISYSGENGYSYRDILCDIINQGLELCDDSSSLFQQSCTMIIMLCQNSYFESEISTICMKIMGIVYNIEYSNAIFSFGLICLGTVVHQFFDNFHCIIEDMIELCCHYIAPQFKDYHTPRLLSSVMVVLTSILEHIQFFDSRIQTTTLDLIEIVTPLCISDEIICDDILCLLIAISKFNIEYILDLKEATDNIDTILESGLKYEYSEDSCTSLMMMIGEFLQENEED